MRHPPVVLGIVGKPVAEREALAAGVTQLLGGAQRVARLSIGDYRRFNRADGVKEAVTAAHPTGLWLDIVEQHLGLLKRGEAVLRPTYNRQRDAFEPAAYVEPRPFVIVDGELGFFTQGLRNNLDIRVFCSSDEPVTEWQGALASDAMAYVESQRKWADLVVEPLPAGGVNGKKGAGLILRPTLPYLELEALISAAGEPTAMRLELARDMGLPVDRVVIDAAINRQAAASFEKRLVAEMAADYRHDAAESALNEAKSGAESLVLTQLLVTLFVLKVASG